jgi:hypothetical protein
MVNTIGGHSQGKKSSSILLEDREGERERRKAGYIIAIWL